MENKILFEELIKSNELVIPIFKKDILELLGMTCLNGYIEKGQLQAGDNIKSYSGNIRCVALFLIFLTKEILFFVLSVVLVKTLSTHSSSPIVLLVSSL